MRLKFTKMHGLGNDFVVPDATRAPIELEREQLRRIADRHFGAGETLACGTGACAAVVSGIQRGLLDKRVTVTTRGGDLSILWEGAGTPVLMTGPAVIVFEGEIEL